MKYDNKLQQEIVEYLNKREDLFYAGYTGTFFYQTWPKWEEKYSIESNKPHGDKTNISAEIKIYSNVYPENEKYGVEFSIEMYHWGYQSQEKMFGGWAENLEEFKIILKAVGL